MPDGKLGGESASFRSHPFVPKQGKWEKKRWVNRGEMERTGDYPGGG